MMKPIKITCPECGRILGDTDKSLDCNFNCRGCKNTVNVKITIAHAADYLKEEDKEEIDGESK